jgi:hypothetical protein
MQAAEEIQVLILYFQLLHQPVAVVEVLAMLLVNIQVVTAVLAVVEVLAVGLILPVEQEHLIKVLPGVHQDHPSVLFLEVVAALVPLVNKEA